MVSIVPAGPEHGPGAYAVADAVRFHPDSARSAEGYLVSIAEAAEYSRRFAASAYSVVAVEEGRVVGFLRVVAGEEPELSPESASLASHLPLPGYLLVDQIGLLPAYKGQGLAQAMLDAVVFRSQPQRLGAVIMHAPLRNARSIGFFAGRNGFSLVRELRDPNFTWGYYEKRIDVVS
ncbi:MAG: GNAT family N-acetyltransferase [Acidobacteria bacterium]|nr:GNAT family N-acetyltransferase [Acidobacteriota bacterium]